jgi:hypothetical protein
VLNPFKYGAFAFQVWGHKVMRWLVPWFMLLLLAASAVLAREQAWYAVALALQLLGYGTAFVGALVPASRRIALVKLAYFFAQVNMALARASLEFLIGRRIVQWEPSARKAGTAM